MTGILDGETLGALRGLVGDAHLRTDPDDLMHYGCDHSKFVGLGPGAVVLPGSIEEVQALVRFAFARNLAVIASGGRTGLSGGAAALGGELVICLDRLNRVLSFDPANRTVTCEAGVITAHLQEYAQERGLYYPVDFASRGSSQIGGNIATNAGGIKVIRYGMTRDWVAGLKVVTGTGELLELNRGLRKNNAGYDLRHLFIGSEGTLGVVVAATLRLAPPASDLRVMVLGLTGMDVIMPVSRAFQSGIELTAFEFFSEPALSLVVERCGLARPFDASAPYYVLLEFEGKCQGVVEAAISAFASCVEAGWVVDGVLSQSLAQSRKLWGLRENISATLSHWSPYKNDVAVTPLKVPAFLKDVEAVVQARAPDFEIIWFGHIGDGNVHLNILKPDQLSYQDFSARCSEIGEDVYAVVAKYGGTISAEHGVGVLKRDYLHYSVSEEEIFLMKQIKAIFDPRSIMNPGKLLPGDAR
jgi:FAD/FMN-containing dehydrogenase